MIVYTDAVLIVPAGGVSVQTTSFARLECGCKVYVGRRTDNAEAATVAKRCRPEHRPVIERFHELMDESLKAPQVGRPLIEVVDEVLAEAGRGESV